MAHTAAASFEVTELTVAPVEINPDESATVSAIITNTGDLEGSYEVILMVNESLTATEEITLEGRASQELSFTLQPDGAGTYTISIGGVTATLTVKAAPAEIEEEPAPSETPATPSEAEAVEPEVTPAPAEAEEEPEAPAEIAPVVPELSVPDTEAAPKRISDWLIFVYVAIAGAIIIGMVYWRIRAGRKVS
ncbi:hypothetical protein ES703_100198 [subsurface metagenome]